MNTLWLDQLAAGVRKVRSSAIRDLLVVTEQPDMISFAGGLPAPECFPTEELTAAAERVLVERPVAALQYGPTEGYRPLREFVADLMQHARPEHPGRAGADAQRLAAGARHCPPSC